LAAAPVHAGIPTLAAECRKLHIQYSHASADQICALLRKRGGCHPAVFAAVREAVAACRVCHVQRGRPGHAVVSLPSPSAFNEAVAADLMSCAGTGAVLHLIDMHSRFCKCTLLADKSAPVVGDALLAWLTTFGAPHRLLTDGGGEFDNDLWRLIVNRFGIFLSATSPQAPWSNGMVERHNASIKTAYGKLLVDEPDALTQTLLDMVCLAKNSLLVYGAATPYQLMCGSQPRLPSTLADAPPSRSGVRVDGDTNLEATLRLLGASRVAFMQAEADQSLRRALNRQTRSPGNTQWARDAAVYYWHAGVSASASGYRGPARVGGQVGRQVLLRHGARRLTRDTGSVIPADPPSGVVTAPAAGPKSPTRVTATAASEETIAEDDGDDVSDVPDLVPVDDIADPEPMTAVEMWAGLSRALEALRMEKDEDSDADLVPPAPADDPSMPGGAPVAPAATLPVSSTFAEAAAAGPRRSGRPRAPVARLGSTADLGEDVSDAALLATMADGPVGLHGSGVDRGPRHSSVLASPALLLAAHTGDDTISSVLRVGETPSAAVHQVLVSRSELRRRQEVPLALAGRRFDAAMADELLAWNTRGVYTEEAAAGQHVISTRWVLTEKPRELPQDPPKRKARLVVRGFEDPHMASVVSTSPAVGRASLHVLLATMAVRGWVPRTVDVRTAFLQGLPLDRVAPVYVQPPPQARVPTSVVWRLHKCAYGLTDAPRRCYEAVLLLMIDLGYARVEPDHGLFVLVLDGTLKFAAAVHVDDFKYAGVAKEVARFETALRAVFDVGPVRIGNLTFTGLRIACDTDASSGKMVIAVDQDHYLESIEEIDVSSERAARRSAAVSTSELTLYRRALGALLWASGQTQPFMACHSSLLARRFIRPWCTTCWR